MVKDSEVAFRSLDPGSSSWPSMFSFSFPPCARRSAWSCEKHKNWLQASSLTSTTGPLSDLNKWCFGGSWFSSVFSIRGFLPVSFRILPKNFFFFYFLAPAPSTLNWKSSSRIPSTAFLQLLSKEKSILFPLNLFRFSSFFPLLFL